jgi:hypothetical protein
MQTHLQLFLNINAIEIMTKLNYIFLPYSDILRQFPYGIISYVKIFQCFPLIHSFIKTHSFEIFAVYLYVL